MAHDGVVRIGSADQVGESISLCDLCAISVSLWNLSDKVALVTGASSGIGTATAKGSILLGLSAGQLML